MITILTNAILPIFFILFLGWVLTYTKLIKVDMAEYLVTYVFWVAGPSIIFSSISHMNLSTFLVWRFIIAYPLSVLIMGVIGFCVFWFLFRERLVNSINYAYSTSIKNTIMIGYPVLISVVGKKAVIPMAVSVIFFNFVFTPLLIIFYGTHQNKDQQMMIKSFIKSALFNPFVMAAILGMIFMLFHIQLPVIVNKLFDYINPSYVPCSLFAIGVELTLFKFGNHWLKLIVVAGMSLIIFPLLALLLAHLLSLSPFYKVALIIFSALPTAKALYMYAKFYHVNEHETAAVISFTTLASLISIPLVIIACHALWPAVFVNIVR